MSVLRPCSLAVAPTIASSSTPSTGVSLFGSSPVQPMGGHMSAASTSGAASPPTVGNLSVGAGGDNWAAAWHDSGKMNVSSGSSNRSAVSSPPAVNPFSVATNLTQLNTSPWPSSSGTSPVSQPSKNHHQQQQQRHIPSQQQQPQPQQPAQAQATFTPQWPSSSATAINDPFNISNVNLGGKLNFHKLQYKQGTSLHVTLSLSLSVSLSLSLSLSSMSHVSYHISCAAHGSCRLDAAKFNCLTFGLGHIFRRQPILRFFSEVRCRWWMECF